MSEILPGGNTVNRYTVRSWVTIGLFGALWGVVELTLGSYLHVIFPPQANTFLTGVVMGGIGALIALTGRHFVPNRGSVFLIAVVTALIKLLSPGGGRVGPFVAILMEGLLMEVPSWSPSGLAPGDSPSAARWLWGGTSFTSS